MTTVRCPPSCSVTYSRVDGSGKSASPSSAIVPALPERFGDRLSAGFKGQKHEGKQDEKRAKMTASRSGQVMHQRKNLMRAIALKKQILRRDSEIRKKPSG